MLSAAAIVAGSLAWYGPPHVRAASPSVPSNVRLSPGAVTNDGLVVITWDAPSDSTIAYYQIFRFNGSSSAEVSEVTYIGRTADARNYFLDQTPTEGLYQYAVIAVDSAATASMPSGWAKVTADFPSNGLGKVEADVTAPATPGNFHAGVVRANGNTVSLGWNQSNSGDLWRNIVYRQDNNGNPKPAGYTSGDHTSFIDTVPGDGNYNYYVVAQDKSGNVSPPTATAGISLTGTAAGVDIRDAVTAPTAAQGLTTPTYNDGTVTLNWTAPATGHVTGYTIYRSSGSNGNPVVVGTTVAGITTFTDQVPADDRYGYFVVANDGSAASPASSAVYTIVDTAAPNIATVTPPANPGNGGNQTLIDLLISLRLDISEAQYNRLLAELRAGHTETFIVLIVEYRGKFITVTSADQLLKAAGYKWESKDKDDDKDDHQDNGNHYGWYTGKGNQDKDHDKGDDKAKGKGDDKGHGKGHDD